MKRIINFDLDFINQDHLVKFKIKQFDNAILKIKAYNLNKPFTVDGGVAKLFIAYNHDVYYQDTGITIEGSEISIDLDPSMIHTPSQALGEIEIKNDDGTTTSTTFTFFITDKLGEGGTVPQAMEGFVEKYNKLIQGVKEHTESSINDIRHQSNVSIKEVERNAKNVHDTIKSTFDTVSNDLNTKTQEKITEITDHATENINNAKQNFDTFSKNLETKTNQIIDRVENQATSAINTTNTNANNSINQVKSESTKAIHDVKKEFTGLTTQQQKELEVLEARDGEESLHLRLERDAKQGKLIEETKGGSYISVDDSVVAPINFELKGNTVQDSVNLSKIVSSGVPTSDGMFEYEVVVCGKNIANNTNFKNGVYYSDRGNETNESNSIMFLDFIKVVPNESIVVSMSKNSTTSIQLCHYAKDQTFIKRETVYHGNKIVIPSDTYYLKYSIYNNVNDDEFQVEYALNRSLFEKYTEQRVKFKLPVQLEKWDRLYYDKEENAWCVEKGTSKFNYTNEKIIKGSDKSPQGFTPFLITYRFGIQTTTDLICNMYTPNNWGSTYPCIYLQDTEAVILTTMTDLAEFTSYIKGLDIVYKSAIPQKIVLPRSEQIKLNSFANKTHIYTLSGEVDAIVKATVSKSLASAIQAQNNELDKVNNELADLKGLKESQDLAYEGEGHVLCKEVKVGLVKGLKLHGKSIVNVLPKLSDLGAGGGAQGQQMKPDSNGVFTGISSNSNYYIYDREIRAESLLPNSTYTAKGFIEINCETSGTINLFYVGTDKTNVIKSYKLNAGITYLQLNEMFSTNALCNGMCGFYTNGTGTVNSIKYTLMMIQGDARQLNISSYIDGLASVGNDKGLDIRTSNYNLFNESFLNSVLEDDGYYHFRSEGNTRASLFFGIVDRNHKQITTMTSNQGVDLSNFDLRGCKVLIGLNGDKKDNKLLFPIEDFALGNFPIYKGCEFEVVDSNHIRVKNIYIKHGLDVGKYIPHKEDKKPILFRNTEGQWEKVATLKSSDNSNRCDSIDSENNIYTKMIKEITEVGEGSWQVADGSKTNTIMFLRMFTESERCELLENNANIYCDKFNPKYVYSADAEGIFINRNMESSNGGVYIRINQNRLETRDVAGFKKFLQNNNTTYTYKGDIVRNYELAPLQVDVHEGAMLVRINSETVKAPFNFKVSSYLVNIVKANRDDIKRIQDEIFKSVVTRFNDMFKNMFNGNLDQVAYMLYPEEYEYGKTIENKPTLLI